MPRKQISFWVRRNRVEVLEEVRAMMRERDRSMTDMWNEALVLWWEREKAKDQGGGGERK